MAEEKSLEELLEEKLKDKEVFLTPHEFDRIYQGYKAGGEQGKVARKVIFIYCETIVDNITNKIDALVDPIYRKIALDRIVEEIFDTERDINKTYVNNQLRRFFRSSRHSLTTSSDIMTRILGLSAA